MMASCFSIRPNIRAALQWRLWTGRVLPQDGGLEPHEVGLDESLIHFRVVVDNYP